MARQDRNPITVPRIQAGSERRHYRLIAVDGDPISDAGALGRVVFVMRAGRVHKNDAPSTGDQQSVWMY